jgi:ATP phosphoribosyltransferase
MSLSKIVIFFSEAAEQTPCHRIQQLNMDFVKDLDNRLLFAIPKKGRLYEQCLTLLNGSDLQFNRKNRLDIALVTNLPVALIFLPAADIPKYVAEGNIDIGITGQDMVAENEAVDDVEEILELGFGKCNLCVQVPVVGESQTIEALVGRRVVTSFEVLAKKIFAPLDAASGKTTKISYVGGSVEAACALGLADGISKLLKIFGLHEPLHIIAIDPIPPFLSTFLPTLVDLVGK